MKILLESQYFPPVQFFTKYLLASDIYIDPNRIFHKQSYRNRCRILGPHKELDLIIPLKKGKNRIPHKDVSISDDHKWRKEHIRALASAYGKAPFFEHYFPQVEELILSEESNLFAFTQSCISWMEKQLGLQLHSLLDNGTIPSDTKDFRDLIHPKTPQPDEHFAPRTYLQCFDADGFSPNLSCLDLLFNEGPGSKQVLTDSCVR